MAHLSVVQWFERYGWPALAAAAAHADVTLPWMPSGAVRCEQTIRETDTSIRRCERPAGHEGNHRVGEVTWGLI